MKTSIGVFFLLLGVSTMCSQDFSQVDATIKFYPKSFDEITELSDFIARDFKTDEEKIRAIYGWIINNVRYDPDEYDVFNYRFKNYRERNAKEEITRILAKEAPTEYDFCLRLRMFCRQIRKRNS